MATIKFQLTPEQVLSLIRQLTLEEQTRIFQQLQKFLEFPKGGKKNTKQDKAEKATGKSNPLVSKIEGRNYYIPDLPLLDFNEPLEFSKYALKKEQLDALSEVFKDEPPAEELVKLLNKQL